MGGESVEASQSKRWRARNESNIQSTDFVFPSLHRLRSLCAVKRPMGFCVERFGLLGLTRVAEKLIPTIAERDLRKGVRVKVAHAAPRERTKDLDPCALVGRLPRWWDELVAMGSTEVKFGIITPVRRCESFLSSRIFSCVIAECTTPSLCTGASHSEFVEFVLMPGHSDSVRKVQRIFVFPSPFIARIFVAILWPEQP